MRAGVLRNVIYSQYTAVCEGDIVLCGEEECMRACVCVCACVCAEGGSSRLPTPRYHARGKKMAQRYVATKVILHI